MKAILLLILILTAITGGYFALQRPGPFGPIPMPYKVTKENWEDLDLANSANVLLIGDEFGLNLNPLVESLRQNTQKNLRIPLKIFNWSKKNEGLHRTLKKLSLIKNSPIMIFYQAPSEILTEKKFDLADYDRIKEYFKNYQDEKIFTTLSLFPVLAPFFYPYHNYFLLNEFIPLTEVIPASEKQKQLELAYLLFENEIKSLIRFAEEKKTKLIILTTPLDLSKPPNEVCENAMNDMISKELKIGINQLTTGEVSNAYRTFLILKESSPGNALVYYYLGKTLLKMKEPQRAKEALELSHAFDCRPTGGQLVFNNIIRKETKNSIDSKIIDLQNIIYHNLENLEESPLEDNKMAQYNNALSNLMEMEIKKVVFKEK